MKREQVIKLASAIGHKLIGMTYSRTYRFKFFPNGGSADCSSYNGACWLGAGFPLLNSKGEEMWTSTRQVYACGCDLIYPASIKVVGREHAPTNLYETFRPGDILLFDFGTDDRANTIDHAAFVDADGNIINERSSKTGIKVDPISFGRNNVVAVLRIREDAKFMEPVEVSASTTTKLLTRRLQILLNVSEVQPNLLCDAKWGEQTTAALNAYKAAQGMEPDGICTTHTWEQLITDLLPGDTGQSEVVEEPEELPTEITLQSPYMRGDRIKAVQSRLNTMGYAVGDVDGVYGPKTAAAVTDLQTRAMAIKAANGVVDNDVLKLLRI